MKARRLDLGTLMRLLLPAIIVALTAFVVAGCCDDDDSSGSSGGGGTDTQASKSKVANFAIVTPEKGTDYGWNQQSIEAA